MHMAASYADADAGSDEGVGGRSTPARSSAARCCGSTRPCRNPGPDRSGCASRVCGVCRTDLHLAEGDLAPRHRPRDAGTRGRRRRRPARARSHSLARGRSHRGALAGPHLRHVPVLRLGPREPVPLPALHRLGRRRRVRGVRGGRGGVRLRLARGVRRRGGRTAAVPRGSSATGPSGGPTSPKAAGSGSTGSGAPRTSRRRSHWPKALASM